MNWRLVLPSGDPDNLSELLDSIYSTHGAIDHRRIIVVIDSDSYPVSRFGVSFVTRRKGPYISGAALNDGVAAVPPDACAIMAADDVRFLTPNALDELAKLSAFGDGRIIFHPAVEGNRFNHPELAPRNPPDLICFGRNCPLPMICSALSPAIRQAVGPFDESFKGYGYEDHDFVKRAGIAGIDYCIDHRIRIYHDGTRSVYRRRQDFGQILQDNRDRYFAKWGEWPAR